MNRLYFCLIILISVITGSYAQAPHVTSVYPESHRVDAPALATIVIGFDTPVDPAIIDHSVLRIFGRWSGPATGTIGFQNGDTEVTFTPDEPFFAGEQVMVNISKSAQASNGTPIENGYGWSFWIATSPGILDQPLLDEIQLRQPGEGLLQTYGAYAGDLNNDGYSDFTVINESSDDLRILLNDGNGGFPNMAVIPMGDGLPSPNEAGDFNNDGLTDLAVCAFGVDSVRIFMGTGNGSFEAPIRVKTGDAPRGIAVLDIDADGDDDMAITNRFSNDMTIITNEGNGLFTTSIVNPLGTGETACAVADANNDGIPDLFIGMYDSQELAILLCDGNGGLTMSDKVSVAGRPWMIAAGDLNGDGHADVVSANSTGHVAVVALGDGAGGLGIPVSYSVNGTFFPLAIDLGDIDGDGDLDMVTSNYSSTNYIVFENDGSGSFSEAATLSAPEHASCVILHDRDNDGDLDISGTDEGADVIRLFENTGVVNIQGTEPIEIININVFPNPFSEKVNIEYQLQSHENVTITVQDVTGEKLASLLKEQQAQGLYQLEWNGKNEAGITLPNGLYFISIKTPGGELAKKVILNHQK